MPITEKSRWELINVLDHGSVQLVDYMADDLDVVNAARVSYGQHKVSMDDGDQKLIAYLMRNRHTTPFEQNAIKVRVKLPIFVAREWQRHRIGWSYNEQSGRYMKLDKEFYTPAPSDVRQRVGKPGHYTYERASPDIAAPFLTGLNINYDDAWLVYETAIEQGVAPEVARLTLPVATYTQMIATCNAHSLMHFLKLRMAANAQWEIRVYAQALYQIFEQLMPITCREFYTHILTA